MPDIIDGRTGELRESPAEVAVREMLAIPSGIYGAPIGPAQIDQMILDIADVIEHVAQVIVVLYEDKHRAEETYLGRFAEFMVMHEKSGTQMARQYAIAKTRTELHELNLAKEKLRYAEEKHKAVQNRSFGRPDPRPVGALLRKREAELMNTPLVHADKVRRVKLTRPVEAIVTLTATVTDAAVREWAGLEPGEEVTDELLEEYVLEESDESLWDLHEITGWDAIGHRRDSKFEVLSEQVQMVAPEAFVPLPGMEDTST